VALSIQLLSCLELELRSEQSSLLSFRARGTGSEPESSPASFQAFSNSAAHSDARGSSSGHSSRQ
jgi:hypothetical protein